MRLPAITPWPSEAIWQAIAPHLPGFTVEVVPEIDSTNAELMRERGEGRHDDGAAAHPEESGKEPGC